MEREIYPISAYKTPDGGVNVWYVDGESRYAGKVSSTRIGKIPLFRWCAASLTPTYGYGVGQAAQFQIESLLPIGEKRADPELRWVMVDMEGWPHFKVYSQVREGFKDEVDGEALLRTLAYYDPDILIVTTRSRRGLEALALDHQKELAALGRDGSGFMVKGWGLPRLNGRVVVDPLEISHLIGFYEEPYPESVPEIVDVLKYLMGLTSSYPFLTSGSFASIASLIGRYNKGSTDAIIKSGFHAGAVDYVSLDEADRWLLREATSDGRKRVLANLAEMLPSAPEERESVVYRCGARTISTSTSPLSGGEPLFTYEKVIIGKRKGEWAGSVRGSVWAGFQLTNPRISPISRKIQRDLISDALLLGVEEAKKRLTEVRPQEGNPFYLVVEREVRLDKGVVRRRGVLMRDGSLKPPLWINPGLEGVDLDAYKRERAGVESQVLSIWEQTRLGDFNQPRPAA